jgi:hypothetical protein
VTQKIPVDEVSLEDSTYMLQVLMNEDEQARLRRILNVGSGFVSFRVGA